METNTTLATLEERLRNEAAMYLERSDTEDTQNGWICSQVARLTGCRIEEMSAQDTLDRISRMLAAQNRWSRSGHPRYDLNRHIALRKLHRALIERKCTASERKPADGVPTQAAGS